MTTQSGFATFYDPGGNLGACGTPIPDDFLGVAVSPTFGKDACNKRIQVDGPQGSVQVTVVDICPSCEPDHLDLTRSAFSQIASPDLGKVPITWSWISNDNS